MKKTITSIFIISLLLIIVVEILTSSSSIIETVGFSFNVWKNNIFPSLFPLLVLSEILVNFGFIEFIGELFKGITIKLFKTNGYSAYVFIMSLLSGFPTSAKYTKELYNKNLITEEEGSKILMFTHFSNPLFIIGTISILFLNNKEVGLLILFCHYISNIIIGIMFRNYVPSKNENNKFSFRSAIKELNKYRTNNYKPIGQIINDSVINSTNTLLLVLGTITLFLILTTIIDNNININPYYQAILNGTIEMTQGLKYISLLGIPLKLKTIISTMIISFGGFSVHMQVISILSDTKIKYYPFLVARILQALISGLLIYFLFEPWINLYTWSL